MKPRQEKCANCGKVFTSRLRDNGKSKHWTKCCGRECAGKLAWKGGPVASRMRRRYGIELDEYDAKLVEQNGVCAICLEKPSYPLYVDHHHETGKVRSLLCARCNNIVGFMEAATWDEVLLYWGYTHFHDEGRCLAIAVQEGASRERALPESGTQYERFLQQQAHQRQTGGAEVPPKDSSALPTSLGFEC